MMKIEFLCLVLTITIDVILNTLPLYVSIPAFTMENLQWLAAIFSIIPNGSFQRNSLSKELVL